MAPWKNSRLPFFLLWVALFCVLTVQDGIQSTPGHQSTQAPVVSNNGLTFGTPQNGQTSGAPQNGQTSGAPQNGQTSGAPQNGQTSGAPQNGQTSPTPQNGHTFGALQNGQTSQKIKNEQTSRTSKTGQTTGTSTNEQSTDGGTKGKPSEKSDSLLSSLSPGLVKIIRQVGSTIPGFEKNLNAGFGLSKSQLVTVNNFIGSLMNVTNSNPNSLSDVFDSLRSAATLLGMFRPKPFPKDTAEMCKMIANSTEDGSTTLAKFLQRNEPLPLDNMWMKESLDNVAYWCANNFTNSTIEKGISYPGLTIPRYHTTYEWKKCQLDITLMLNGVSKADMSSDSGMWALLMLDSSGKLGSGIMRGNLKFLGNSKECHDVSHVDRNSLSKVEGKICRAYIKPPIDLPPSPLTPGGARIGWDLCLPKSCLAEDLNLAIVENDIAPNVFMDCTEDLDISDDSAAICAIVVLIMFGLLLVAGTVLELCMKSTPPAQRHRSNGHVINGHAQINQGFDQVDGKNDVTSFSELNGKPPMIEMNMPEVDQKNGMQEKVDVKETKDNVLKSPTAHLYRWEKALLAFSIPRNTGKILSVKAAPGTIGCLHGIRVLSMAWVILGHTLIMMGIYENPADLFGLIDTLGFQLILNAPLAVDTFFVMSGLLTCYLFLKTLGKKGKITPKELAMYYVHRYWRLTPSLAIWMMIVACLMQYIGEGRPTWHDYAAAEVCRKNWWTNILYINNVYKQTEACVGVTWFLAHDMQFYVVAPLVMVPWVYGKKVLGFFMAFLYIGIHVSSTIWLEIEYNADLLRNQQDYSPEIYFKPYTRVAPFAIGLMMGWVLWKTKCKVNMNKCVVLLGWIVSLALILTLTLVTYDENKDMPASDWTKSGRVVFETLYRPVWAMAISWLIFACATGYGGYINSVLSWEGWLPLSRLTYSAYLIHLTILGYETTVPEYTFLFTLTSVSYYFIGIFVMAYAVGYILTIVVESPMLGLEKVVLG